MAKIKDDWTNDPDVVNFLERMDEPGTWSEEHDVIHTVGGLTNDKEGSFMEFQNKIDDSFKPNLTPREILLSGAFGGAYFGRRVLEGDYDYQSLFEETLQGVPADKYLGEKYQAKRNMFKVKSGMPYDYWKDKGWMHNDDPYGWFEWYVKYYNGRRHSDDARQIHRWKEFCGINGRWRKIIYRKIYDSKSWDVSPRIQQSLLHWGYRVNEQDFIIWQKSTNHKLITIDK